MPSFLTPLPEGTESKGQGISVRGGDLNAGNTPRRQSRARAEGARQRAPLHASPTPLGRQLCPARAKHQAPCCHQQLQSQKLPREQELPPPPSCSGAHSTQRRWGGGDDRLPPCCCLQPSPSPTRLIAIVRAAEQPGVIGEFVVLGEGTRTCPKPRICHQEGGLSSVRGGGKEQAAISCQPGRWCQQRRG